MEEKHGVLTKRGAGMPNPTDAWKKLIDENLKPADEARSAALSLWLDSWLVTNDKLVLLNLNASTQAMIILRNTLKKIKPGDSKEEIEAKLADSFEEIKKLHQAFSTIKLNETSYTIPVNLDQNKEDEMESMLFHVSNINEQPNTKKNTSANLAKAEMIQMTASAAGGLASASIQEVADFSARTAHVSNQTLIALRDPLPPSIASGAHIASVVASGLNLIAFPIILLAAYLRGDEIKLSKEDAGRLGRSAVTLGLGIAGLVIAPAIAIPLMIASAVFAAGTTLIGLGNFLWGRYKQNKLIQEKHTELAKTTEEVQQLRTDMLEKLEKGEPIDYATYTAKTQQQITQAQGLKTLIKARDQAGTLRQIIPRSLGFVIGAAIIAGAVLLIVPPLAPIGIAIIMGAAAAGLALMGGVIASHIILGRKAKEKEKLKTEAHIEKQQVEQKVHETTSDLVTRLGITVTNLSHKARVQGITTRLEFITKEILLPQPNETSEKLKSELIQFFVNYCKAHQDDSRSMLKANTVFYEIPEKTRDAALAQMKILVNVDKGKLISPDDLKVLQQFDKTHDFFHEHGIGVEFISKTKPEKSQPSAAPSREEDHPDKFEPR